MRQEDQLQKQISQWMQIQHPGIIFRFDLASGGLSTIGMALRNNQMNPHRGYPDLFIAAPRGGYHALFVELKIIGTKLVREKDAKKILKGETKLRKKGDWYDNHIEEQAEMLVKLSKFGYKAVFGVGFDNCIKIIDDYLKLQC